MDVDVGAVLGVVGVAFGIWQYMRAEGKQRAQQASEGELLVETHVREDAHDGRLLIFDAQATNRSGRAVSAADFSTGHVSFSEYRGWSDKGLGHAKSIGPGETATFTLEIPRPADLHAQGGPRSWLYFTDANGTIWSRSSAGKLEREKSLRRRISRSQYRTLRRLGLDPF